MSRGARKGLILVLLLLAIGLAALHLARRRSLVTAPGAVGGPDVGSQTDDVPSGALPLRPDPRLTPGAVATKDPRVFCRPGYSRTVRHTSGQLKSEIYAEYGLARAQSHFEVDHLIPLGLGGADVRENLWPQSYDTPQWNARAKDRLELFLREEVCNRRMDAADAQNEIRSDWIEAYKRHLGSP
jgi:hypothetical protein